MQWLKEQGADINAIVEPSHQDGGTPYDQPSADLPQLYPTTVTIKANGKPVEGVSVRVSRMENEVPYFIGGITNANGVAEIIAQTPTGIFKGAPEGNLAVTATKGVTYSPTGIANDSVAIQVLDTAFTNPKTTPLSLTVSKSGPNTAEFEVTARPEFADKL